MPLRPLPLALLALMLSLLPAPAQAAQDPYSVLQVPACKTSVYVGSVTMELGRFERKGAGFEASYKAKVFPFFFLSEHGTLRIEASEQQVLALKKGEKVDFIGTATASNGEKRKIEGRASPEGPLSGALKIRVLVSRSIKLAFPGSYRFGE